jgi:HCOMODA/2-hydroxy-3-carboxy-muconic semialdehyde decarboxylase
MAAVGRDTAGSAEPDDGPELPGHVEADLRDEIILAGRVLAARGLVEGFGHVSARASVDGNDVLIITPRRALALVERDELVMMDVGTGAVLAGNPPLEVAMHRSLYLADPSVQGVVRAHPAMVSAFGATGRPVRVLHGFGAWLGETVPVHDATTLVTDEEHGTRLSSQMPAAGALLLRGNGMVVTGRSVVEALYKAIVLEEAATLQYHAAQLGEPRYWTSEQCAVRNAQDFDHEPVRAWEHYRRELEVLGW